MTVPKLPTAQSTNYYTLLGLPPPGTSTALSPQTIKRAYHRALLRHHPDKSQTRTTSTTSTASPPDPETPTLDILTAAYTTLSTPSLRAAYDRSLLVVSSKSTSPTQQSTPEQVDLDDMGFDTEKGGWFQECRCSSEGGFVVREVELEEIAEEGGREVLVGCSGCSLWVKVGFGVVEGEGEE